LAELAFRPEDLQGSEAILLGREASLPIAQLRVWRFVRRGEKVIDRGHAITLHALHLSPDGQIFSWRYAPYKFVLARAAVPKQPIDPMTSVVFPVITAGSCPVFACATIQAIAG
jgi:hypothetical protein